jgi:putative nucleotidyltransferase with HDIG domain
VIRLPPKVIATTTLIGVAPVAAVWGLRAAGVLGSFVECAAFGALLSLFICSVAARVWERSDRAGDVLFGDLMLWGWIRREYQQRRLADAASLLGVHRIEGGSDPLSLTVERRTSLLEQLAHDLETRDPYTHGHSRRVARYASMIARRMGVRGAELARIRTAAAVHDVGKLETPTAILHKPGRLTGSEFAVVREHPVSGARMVSILEDPELGGIVRHHHERLDGTGYPDRLAGDAIPLGARIIAVADTFDAITSARPYRAARAHRQAIEVLRAEAGTQLDSNAVNAFCSVYLGRRPLSAWIAVTDLGERIVAWLVPDALGSTARVVALAATTAAVGGGIVALPASARRPGSAEATRTARSGRTAGATVAESSTRGSLADGARSTAAPGAVHGRAPALARTTGGGQILGGSGSGANHIRVTPVASAPAAPGTAAPTGTVASTIGGTSSAGASMDSAAGPLPSAAPTVQVGGGPSPGTGSSTAGVHITAGTGSGSTSIGAGAGTGGSGPTVTAGVTLGGGAGGSGSSDPGSNASSSAPSVGISAGSGSSSGPGVGVAVNVPGLASVKLNVGG